MSDVAVRIADADVQKYIDLYKKSYGLVIDKETAVRKLHQLVRQMELVYRPITQQQVDALKNEDENTDEPIRSEGDK